jgi:arsenate reductase (thioredoxin)
MKNTLFEPIQKLITSFDFSEIDSKRKLLLQPLIDYIQNQVSKNEMVHLNLICTHNSRRSHLSQIWAQTAAAFYQIPQVFCYSGGTEATAMFPMVAETLQNTGFQIEKLSYESNPVYAVKMGENLPAVICFSKKYDAPFNPVSNFAAIMTCSQADQGCPFILGASARIPITYEDPKAFDLTPIQADKYQERSMQIALEMAFVFSNIKR